ncbi:hypothetical protein ACJJIE_09835 [Microbulbifer sp. TRSA001]|uniref:hypothetical protein n=1 Tax=Microbulbifer sp. TRSA001 TaxID=3243381 RepID=UPI0040395A63
MNQRNSWTTFDNDVLADFSINFSAGISIGEIFDIVESILMLTEKYQICIIDVDGKPNDYMDYLKFTWDSFDFVFPFYLPGYRVYSGDFKYPFTKVSMYEQGEIVHRYVSEMCNSGGDASYITCKKELGRGMFEYHNYFSACPEMVPPITLSMSKFSKGKTRNAPWSLIGAVRSDIWLEKVSPHEIHGDDHGMSINDMCNNRELARYNAPRLKGFLRELKDLSSKNNGEWFFESEFEGANVLMS